MNVLALETSTEHCSVALLHGGGEAVRAELAGQRHSELVLPMVDAVLAEAGMALRDLDGIAFGAGPGSFTGLRIACGVAQGLAFGADLKVVPVGTLLALAQAAATNAMAASRVLACLDARMGEVYHAAYERRNDTWHEVIAPNVCRAQEAPLLEGAGWTGAGSAFKAYGEVLAQRYAGQLASVDAAAYPQAAAVARLAVGILAAGGGVPAEQATPLYVRDRVALKMHEQR